MWPAVSLINCVQWLTAMVAASENVYAEPLGGERAMRGTLLLLAVMAATATPLPAFASIQPEIVCIDADIEFPVACDEDDDD